MSPRDKYFSPRRADKKGAGLRVDDHRRRLSPGRAHYEKGGLLEICPPPWRNWLKHQPPVRLQTVGNCVDSVVMDNKSNCQFSWQNKVSVAATPATTRGHRPTSGHNRKELHQLGSWGHSPGGMEFYKDLPVSLSEIGFIRWYFFSHSTIDSSVWACNS